MRKTLANFYLDALQRAYDALPVTSTPNEFILGHGNWGLSEAEYNCAKILADAITSEYKV